MREESLPPAAVGGWVRPEGLFQWLDRESIRVRSGLYRSASTKCATAYPQIKMGLNKFGSEDLKQIQLVHYCIEIT
jgi:hypothetical protein